MEDFLWGLWNGITAWLVLLGHLFGVLPDDEYPVYDTERTGDWYDLGFLIGAGSPFLGLLGV